MNIIPLDKSNVDLLVSYCYVARSDIHPHLLQGTIRKQNLYASKIEQGLRGLIAQDHKGVTGIAEWMPVEISYLGFDLPGVNYLRCIFVKKEFAGQGCGGMLMESLMAECGDMPLLTFGYDYPDHMPRTFFERYGFTTIETHGDMYLMLRPAGEWDVGRAASKGPFFYPKAVHEQIRGRKPLFLFHNDFCPYNWLSLQRILKDVKGHEDVYFRLINCNFRRYPESCGECPTLYLDGNLITWHPCEAGFVKGLLGKK